MCLRLWVSTEKGQDLDPFVEVDKIDKEGKVIPFVAFSMTNDSSLGLGWCRVGHRELENAKSTIVRPLPQARTSIASSA